VWQAGIRGGVREGGPVGGDEGGDEPEQARESAITYARYSGHRLPRTGAGYGTGPSAKR
jgi:hypothetical protein